MEIERPGYWAVLPASVRYDGALTASAKLLYAEISALAQVDGYCWASNQYLAALFNLDKKSISRLINTLADRGYIRVVVERSEAGQVVCRKIFTGLFLVQPVEAPDTAEEGAPSPQNCGVFNRKNNKSIEHTPLPPRAKVSEEVQSVLKSYVGNDRELAQLLVDFLDARVKLKKPLQTARAAKILVNKLDKLSGGDRALKIALLDNAILHNWTSVYPLKADELPRAGTEDAGARMPLRGEGVQYL